MKRYILTSCFAIFMATNLPAQKTKELIHYNVIFVPDLSNRLNVKLYPKSVNDAEIVSGVLNNIWPNILKLKRDQGQLDHYSVDFINKGLIGLYKINTDLLHIDFQRFSKQVDRINYIMSRAHVSQTLPKDIDNFNLEYRKFNVKAAASNNGADIWTYFQSGIDSRIVLPQIQTGNTIQSYRNIIVLLTDGYIEAGIYGKGYDLAAAKIGAFRTAFLKSKVDDMNMFLSKNPRYKIIPVKNSYLMNAEVIILEMYDRSLSKTGAATKHPTDMEIMRVVWADWLKSSGVKRFELKPVATNKAEAVKYVMDFIKSK